MREIEDKDVERLSNIYDPESKDTFISVYINPSTDFRSFLRKRVGACRNILKKDEQLLDNFNKTMEVVSKLIEDIKGKRSLIIFASHIRNFLEVYSSPREVDNALIVDTSPYIKPAVKTLENYAEVGLILLDTNRAKLFTLCQEKLIPRKKLSEDILNRHKKGGWSQARFQRIRKEEIKSFMKEVVEACNKVFGSIDTVVLAGPGEGKNIFLKMAPRDLKSKITEVVDVDFDEKEKELLEILEKVRDEKEEKMKMFFIEKIEREILRDGLAVYGIREVLKGSMMGKLDTLIVEEDFKVGGWICERCQIVEVGRENRCPCCGNLVSEVDVVEEIMEFCERFNSKIVFVQKGTIEWMGRIAGLLRYK